MLVTDGAVDTYDAIFAKYNWPDRKVVYKKHQRALSHYCPIGDWRTFQSKVRLSQWSQRTSLTTKRSFNLLLWWMIRTGVQGPGDPFPRCGTDSPSTVPAVILEYMETSMCVSFWPPSQVCEADVLKKEKVLVIFPFFFSCKSDLHYHSTLSCDLLEYISGH